MTAILFWDWDKGIQHAVAARRVIAELLKSAIDDKDKIGGVQGTMPELTFEELSEAFNLREGSQEFYYSLNDRYELEIKYYPDFGDGYVRIIRPWGKLHRRVGRSWNWTEEITV